METENTVSIWVGNFSSREELDTYIDLRYDDDGEIVSSKFYDAFQIDIDDIDDYLIEKEYCDSRFSNVYDHIIGASYADVVMENLNQNCNGNLLSDEMLDDLKSCEKAINECLNQLNSELGLLEKKKNEISSSQDPSYTSGFVDIFLALDGLEESFSELKHMSIAMNKHYMYESGEISEEEYLDDGILNVEMVDEGDEE